MGGVVMRGGGVTVGGDSSTGSSVMAASRKKSLYVKLEKMDSMPVSSEGSSTGVANPGGPSLLLKRQHDREPDQLGDNAARAFGP